MNALKFSNLPVLIQERFVELCDSQTLLTFSKINQKTKWLSRKRKIVENYRIHNGFTEYCNQNKDEICGSMNDFDKSIEIFGELNIVDSFMEEDIKGILKTYSYLNVHPRLDDFNIFKHLIGPKLEECHIYIKIPRNMEIEELQNNLRMLVELLASVNYIFLNVRLQDNQKIVENELLKLSKRPLLLISKNLQPAKFCLFIDNSETVQYFL